MGGSEVLLNLIGGVALLLWGVRMVRTGVTRAWSAQLRRIVAKGTTNRLAAFTAGLTVTAVLQSSTATALVVASFAGRGLIAVAPALALMLGADVGSTLVAQVLSLRLHWLSPLLLAFGVGSFMASRKPKVRQIGRIALGLGLMLLALSLVLETSSALRSSPIVLDVLGALGSEPLLALIIAAVLTWLAHSSLAIVLLIMSLAATAVVPLPLALVLVLGANIGGAIAPLLITAPDGPVARRVPLGNLLMRTLGALGALLLVPLVAPLLATVDDDPARMVVNFHTAFNLGLAAVFLPLVPLVGWLSSKLLPAPAVADDEAQPRHLDRQALTDKPAVALGGAARETLRLADLVERMLADSIVVLQRDDAELAREIAQTDDTVDRLHEAIKLYLIEVARHDLSPELAQRCRELQSLATNLEHVGDIIDKNLMELARKKIRHGLAFSEKGLQEITDFHGRVLDNFKLAMNVVVSHDIGLARALLREKRALREAENQAAQSHFRRLETRRPETLETSSIHLDVIRDLKRINSHVSSVAYGLLEQAGQLHSSRLRGESEGSDDARSRESDDSPLEERRTAGGLRKSEQGTAAG